MLRYLNVLRNWNLETTQKFAMAQNTNSLYWI